MRDGRAFFHAPKFVAMYEEGRRAFNRGESVTSQKMFPGAGLSGWLDALADKMDEVSSILALEKPNERPDEPIPGPG